jgi:predicted Zn-ribbon and HTH transcriptional regulator
MLSALEQAMTEEYYDDEPTKPFWRCESCGHEDHKKPMPKDRAKFYSSDQIGNRCPRCKSESLVPVGF